jgi:hypothetical protein
MNKMKTGGAAGGSNQSTQSDQLNLESTNVKTSTISRILKVSNAFDRDAAMSYA